MLLRHCKHMPVFFVCSVPPSPQYDQTSKPKNVSTTTHLVSGWKSDTEEISKQKKLKQREEGDRGGQEDTRGNQKERDRSSK